MQEIPSTSKEISVFDSAHPEPCERASSVGPSSEDEETIDAELEKLRRMHKKKEEIQTLKQQFRAMQLDTIEPSPHPSSVCNFRDVEDSVSPFSGDDNFSIQFWIEQFEECSEVLGLDERNKFIYAKRLFKGTAKLFIRTVNVRTWTQLRSALRKEFQKVVTRCDVYDELRDRKKRRDESMQQYVLHMQEIASHSRVEEEDLIKFIIKGIPDSEVNKTILYSADSLEELSQPYGNTPI